MNAWITKLKKCSQEYQSEKKTKKNMARKNSNYKRSPTKLKGKTAGQDTLARSIYNSEMKQYVKQNMNMARKIRGN